MENSEQEIIAFAVPVFWNNIVMPLGLTMPISRCSSAERKKSLNSSKLMRIVYPTVLSADKSPTCSLEFTVSLPSFLCISLA